MKETSRKDEHAIGVQHESQPPDRNAPRPPRPPSRTPPEEGRFARRAAAQAASVIPLTAGLLGRYRCFPAGSFWFPRDAPSGRLTNACPTMGSGTLVGGRIRRRRACTSGFCSII